MSPPCACFLYCILLQVCSKWFVCAYADVLPVETTLRLWDCLFAEGSKVLLRAAVALVLDPDNRQRILGCTEFGELAACFKSLTVGERATRCHEFITVRRDVAKTKAGVL